MTLGFELLGVLLTMRWWPDLGLGRAARFGQSAGRAVDSRPNVTGPVVDEVRPKPPEVSHDVDSAGDK